MQNPEWNNRNRKIDFSYSGYCLLAIAYCLFFSSNSFAGNPVSPEQRAYAEEYLHNQSAKGFIENKGQMTDDKNDPVPNVLFKSELPGVDLYITNTGFTYVFLKYTKEESKRDKYEKEREDNPLSSFDYAQDRFGEGRGEVENIKTDYARVDVILKDGTIKKENIVVEYPSQEDFRYYLGSCSQGITGVRKYQKITIKKVYPGIDWVWYINKNGVVKYDFEVHALANPAQIQMQYKWADIQTQHNGENLNISTPIGELTEGSAVSYNNGKTIATRYELKDNTVSFKTERYDHNKNLTIDPPLQLVWSSLYGGNDNAVAFGITSNNFGNVFVTGYTSSANFPTYTVTGAYNQGAYGGATDCFILKFTADGVLAWATYYGGSKFDAGKSISSDPAGNIFVVGMTSSNTNFPTYDPGGGAYFDNSFNVGTDCFILKFDNNGVRKWASYFGGGTEEPYAICNDLTGNIFITGYTRGSASFPILALAGAYSQPAIIGGADCFIVKFGNGGVLLWGTYYGGTLDEGSFQGNRVASICTDATGNVFVSGFTMSTDFPTLALAGAYNQPANGGGNPATAFDSFILKFDNNGVRLWATYFGGDGNDQSRSICTDAAGNLFVIGFNLGGSVFPTKVLAGAYNQAANAGGFDSFILKFNANGAQVWGTFYGGIYGDMGGSITTDATGNLFVSGYTQNTTLSTSNFGGGAYFQGANGGTGFSYDLFFSMFTNAGIRKWATYFGGNGSEYLPVIIVNPANCDLYFTGDGGSIGYTVSTYTTFPSVDAGGGAWFQNQPGAYNVSYPIVGRFKGAVNCQLPLSVSVTATNIICNGDSTGSTTANVSGGISPFTYEWNPNGKTTQTISGLAVGTYTVIVTDALMATTSATVTIISLNTITAMASGDATIQNGQSTSLNASGGAYYQWNPATGLSCESCQNPTASPTATTIYCVTVSDINGCSDSACVTVNIEAKCEAFFIPTAFSPNNDNNNDCLHIYGNTSCLKSFYLVIYDRWGEKIFSSKDPATCWDGVYKNKELSSGIFVYYLNIITLKGEEINKQGNFSLIR